MIRDRTWESAKSHTLRTIASHVFRALSALVPKMPLSLCTLVSQVPLALRAVLPHMPRVLSTVVIHLPYILYVLLLTYLVPYVLLCPLSHASFSCHVFYILSWISCLVVLVSCSSYIWGVLAVWFFPALKKINCFDMQLLLKKGCTNGFSYKRSKPP